MIGKINAEDLQKQDPFVYDEIFVKNTYNITPEDLKDADVIDIGANKGFFTILAVVNGARSVLAVEPGQKQFKQLMKNTEGMYNVTFQPYAVASQPHEVLFLTDEDGSSKLNSIEGERVNTVTLEQIVSSVGPSENMILKMDIEGSEFDVLLNADNQLLKKFKTICLEIHDENRKELILKKLESAGFKGNFLNALYTASGPLGVETWKFNVKMNQKEVEPTVLDFKDDVKVTCTISTKDRYDTTLPLCLMSVINQTRKPNKIIIFDDGEQKDLRQNPTYMTLFNLMDLNGIEWKVLFGKRLGQHFNHQMANTMDDLIWRIDDDEVANPDVLEKLLTYMEEGVGAVGGSVIVPSPDRFIPTDATNKMTEIFHKPNLQWSHGEGVVEVEHLYSSFLYRPKIAQYNLKLSPVAHREETLFTHELFRKGYKLLVCRDAITWHFRQENGGIRSHSNEWFFKHDEKIFQEQMEKWGYKLISLNVGLGDHFAFSNLIPELLEKYKYLMIGCCYPEVFAGIDTSRITLLPVGLTEKFTDEHVFKYMWDNFWAGSNYINAYAKMYGVDTPKNRHIMKVHEMPEKCTILISPYSRLLRTGKENPKNYPYWEDLVKLLEGAGHYVIQIGEKNEKPVAKDFRTGLSLSDVKTLVRTTNFWVSVDNFLPHLAWTISDKPGVVIWSKSDPLIYGYQENLNILKSRANLRRLQFDIWEKEYFDARDFWDAEKVFSLINKWIENKCQME